MDNIIRQFQTMDKKEQKSFLSLSYGKHSPNVDIVTKRFVLDLYVAFEHKRHQLDEDTNIELMQKFMIIFSQKAPSYNETHDETQPERKQRKKLTRKGRLVEKPKPNPKSKPVPIRQNTSSADAKQFTKYLTDIDGIGIATAQRVAGTHPKDKSLFPKFGLVQPTSVQEFINLFKKIGEEKMKEIIKSAKQVSDTRADYIINHFRPLL